MGRIIGGLFDLRYTKCGWEIAGLRTSLLERRGSRAVHARHWAGRARGPLGRAYLAISDFPFYIYGENVRIFSVADQRQKFATKGTPSGGTWIANDRFVWASGSLMQWSPSTGVTLLRSEYWYGVTGSGDGHWLAGMLFAKLDANSYDNSKPRGLIVAVGGGTTFQPTGLASSPGFVTPTVVWYAEEGPSTEGGLAGDTSPTGVIRAFNLASASDQAVRFVAGEAPTQFQCCAPRG